MADIDNVLERLKSAEQRLKDVAQGRRFTVGTQVLFRGELAVITDLNQGSEDPSGSTVDLRTHDGKVHKNVSVTSSQLELFRS